MAQPIIGRITRDCDWLRHRLIEVNFSKLTDMNQIFRIEFVCLHYHLGEKSSQIIQCIIFAPNELTITIDFMVALSFTTFVQLLVEFSSVAKWLLSTHVLWPITINRKRVRILIVSLGNYLDNIKNVGTIEEKNYSLKRCDTF